MNTKFKTMRQQNKSDILNSIFDNDPFLLLSSEYAINANFEHLTTKAAKVQTSPKGRHYIKAGSRVYLPTLNNYSSLTDGKTYIFNKDKTKVKRLLNWI